MVIDKFGIAAVRNAWYNPSQVAEHVIHGYTKVIFSAISFLFYCWYCPCHCFVLEMSVVTWMLVLNAAIED